ncbi:hypothetical protein EUA06_21035 [Nocardioides glacieisoli]|uniref:Uncharacterized protein n=1 Tax=Nocardioides glacieisoli TaxID=1168730 RepID=A0A4V1RJE3_9ACTN|nr:hypothetical protein [Nocardioides glacieisoli]RYB88482.1 hypothetical protein EUA06_21035 [Nocardioides glacieisoli]
MQPMNLSAASVLLALFSCAMWFVWFGWDDVPYDVWQVIGCGVFIVAGAIVALARARRGVVLLAAAATVGFAVPWAVYAAATDDSGLWAVGLVLLLVGAFVGLVVVLFVAARVMRLASR